MTRIHRFLTKSRFMMALECPTKLHYAGNPKLHDASQEDSFLAALAEGGHQVGAMARLMYPQGVLVDAATHAEQVEQTRKLLERPQAVIFEAAFQCEGLFVRVDIVRKHGETVDLVEVKAKSVDPAQVPPFRTARGGIDAQFLPYLRDITFQRHVCRLARPDLSFNCSLVLVDKTAKASVHGMNQMFLVTKLPNGQADVRLQPGVTFADLGDSILCELPVNAHADEIEAGELSLGSLGLLPFGAAAGRLAQACATDEFIDPKPGLACRSCQFKTGSPPQAGALRSGFHECWNRAFGWTEVDFAAPTTLELWNSRRTGRLIEARKLKLSDLAEVDLDDKPIGAPGPAGMRPAHRQWFQAAGKWPGGGPFFLNRDGLAEAMSSWRYPLNFIDFETSTVAIPFHKGRHPYEIVAFQFSHHVLYGDGTLVHQRQYLDTRRGQDPNRDFIRALCDTLSENNGTVFRWSNHENTVLNVLRDQLAESGAAGASTPRLVEFLDSLITKGEGEDRVVGSRFMVDLCRLAEKHFFHPGTRGSSSLKKVLPALMASSDYLRREYSQATYAHDPKSLNFKKPIAWWQRKGDGVCDPYELLPPIEGSDPVRDGGAALGAYARLQLVDLSPREREALCLSLLQYCELDTLAMAMAVQAWRSWLSGPAS